ncbi:lysophosphatidylserine lipase ABHD12-like [Euwallacea fornicatus]|uniref:lysophosphatidylserine lipase ABHD12-like n=1 Tax=Euwallacea fornicatus TaxID=995702 RepID=UPI00338EBB53
MPVNLAYGKMIQVTSQMRANSTQSLSGGETERRNIQKRISRNISKVAFLIVIIIVFLVFILIWVIIPVSFMFSLNFQIFMVFFPIDSPRNADFDHPETFGIEGVHNFHLTTKDYYDNSISTSIGAWLVLHEDDINNITSNNVTEILETTQRDILLYFHGVLCNRAKALDQYRVLRKHFLIVAVDHRGYGDSGKNVRVGEDGIVHDHIQIYDWVRSINPSSDFYYWGHSLGSALSAHTVRLIKELRSEVPKGLVLESPFTSIKDVLVNIVLGKIFSWLVYFDHTILAPLEENGFHFRSKDNVIPIDCPIMILHAEDDYVIPYFLGENLANIVKESRQAEQGDLVFHGISSDYGFGHNNIVFHPNIGTFIQDFKAVCRNFTDSS